MVNSKPSGTAMRRPSDLLHSPHSLIYPCENGSSREAYESRAGHVRGKFDSDEVGSRSDECCPGGGGITARIVMRPFLFAVLIKKL